MTQACFTNELVEHLLRTLAEHPRATVPELLMAARAAYVRGHPGLDNKLRQLATAGKADAGEADFGHLLTVAEWVYYGDRGAIIPRVGSPKEMSRHVVSVSGPLRLDLINGSWRTSFAATGDDGQAVLAIFADVVISDRDAFVLSVQQNGKGLSAVDSHHDTEYQNIGRDCRGGYVSGVPYRACFLLAITPGAGEQHLEVSLLKGSSALLTSGTEVTAWPADFRRRIGLRRTPPTKQPVKIVGDAKSSV